MRGKKRFEAIIGVDASDPEEMCSSLSLQLNGQGSRINREDPLNRRRAQIRGCIHVIRKWTGVVCPVQEHATDRSGVQLTPCQHHRNCNQKEAARQPKPTLWT
jgi:hypothetical protein